MHTHNIVLTGQKLNSQCCLCPFRLVLHWGSSYSSSQACWCSTVVTSSLNHQRQYVSPATLWDLKYICLLMMGTKSSLLIEIPKKWNKLGLSFKVSSKPACFSNLIELMVSTSTLLISPFIMLSFSPNYYFGCTNQTNNIISKILFVECPVPWLLWSPKVKKNKQCFPWVE